MTMHSLEDLFVDKLKDIYDAERRITRALPKMVKAASSEDLVSAFKTHLQETEEQIERLDRIFEGLDKTPGRKTCHGMIGILEEGQETMTKDAPEWLMDAALIAGAQEVEHYEIAAYGCLHAWAEVLGKREAAELLQESLKEEEAADSKLTLIASSVNPRALEMEDEEEEGEMAMAGARRRSGNGKSTSSRRSR